MKKIRISTVGWVKLIFALILTELFNPGEIIIDVFLNAAPPSNPEITVLIKVVEFLVGMATYYGLFRLVTK